MMLKPQNILGLPKGDLESSTLAVLKQANLEFAKTDRRLWLHCNDHRYVGVLLRPSEILTFVASGQIGLGFVGYDHVLNESLGRKIAAHSVRRIADLGSSKILFSPVRWVLAVPIESGWRSLDDLRILRRTLNVATEIPFIARRWLAQQGISAKVQLSLGSTEAKAPQFCDAIVDCAHSGQTLMQNGLQEIAQVCTSTTQLIANATLLSREDEFYVRTTKLVEKIKQIVERAKK